MFVFSLSVVAQTKVCMGGNLDTLAGAEKRACENQVQMVRDAAVASKAPGDWHFVVVCGEDGWKDYMAFSSQGETALRAAAADTDFQNKTTYLRGTRLNSAEASIQVVADSFRQPSTGTLQMALK